MSMTHHFATRSRRRLAAVALLAVLLAACGGGGTAGGGGVAPPTTTSASRFDYTLAPGVIDVPEAALARYTIDIGQQTMHTTDTRDLPIGSVMKVGGVAIKLSEALASPTGRSFRWTAPLPDEMFDSFDLQLEESVSFDVTSDTSPGGQDRKTASEAGMGRAQAVTLSALTEVDSAGKAWTGIKVAFEQDFGAKSKFSGDVKALGALHPGTRISKSARGAAVKSNWAMDIRVVPNLSLSFGAGDALTPSGPTSLAIPRCVRGGLFGDRNASEPGTARYVLTGRSIPKPLGLLGPAVSFIMPVCAVASLSDSRFGMDLAHSTEYQATITKQADQRWPSVQPLPPSGSVKDAIARSWPKVSAKVSVSGRIEAAPTLLVFLTIPLTGVVVDPGATAEATASVGAGKQNVCGDLQLDAKVKGWAVFDALIGLLTSTNGLTSTSDTKELTLWEYTRTLVSGHHFAGDPCDTDPPPQQPQPPEPATPTESPIPVAGSPATCPSTPARDFSARGTQLGLNRSFVDPLLEGPRLQVMRPDAYAIDVAESRRQGFTLQQVIDDVDRTIAGLVGTRDSAWQAAQEVAAFAGLVEGLRRNGLPADFSCAGGVGAMACLGTTMNWFIEYMIDLRKNAACYYP